MDVMEARATLKALVEQYFQDAAVYYAKQSFRVKGTKPLVTLSFGAVKRPLHPPTEIFDGRPVAYYPTVLQVQVDLFTHGKLRSMGKGVTPAAENTAAEDMMQFVNFLGSAYATRYCHEHDIAIVPLTDVQDLTDLINDTNYEYRAMIELELRFTSVAIGYTGTLDPSSIHWATGTLEPEISTTVSGGGNPELVGEEGDYFTSVEITEEP